MKEQVRKNEETREFKGQYSHYTVWMRMASSGSLLIEVENSISFDRWKRVIDGQFIEAQEHMFYRNVFAEPELIFEYISENFSDVSFQPSMFSFIYSFGAPQNKKKKIMTIPLEKGEMNLTYLAHVKIDKMRQEFAEKLIQRDTRIKFLEQKSAKMEDLLQKLTQKLAHMKMKYEEGTVRLGAEVRGLQKGLAREVQNSRQFQQKYKCVQQRLDREQEVSKELQQRLKKEEQRNRNMQQSLEREGVRSQQVQQRLRKEERNKNIQQKLEVEGEKRKDSQQILKKSERERTISQKVKQRLKQEEERMRLVQKNQWEANAVTAHQVQVLKDRQKQCERFINLPQIAHHLANPYSHYYSLAKSTASSAKLAKIGGGGLGAVYNFVNKTELFPKQQNKYAVRIVKARDSWLMIGFCTRNIIDYNNYKNAESAYYYCYGNGCLFEGGVHQALSRCGSFNGELVECVADLLEGRISWWKGGKVLCECAVPAAMKGKPLFFSLLLAYEGDSVEVSSA